METTFSGLLRRHRLDAGLTQEALAERASLSVAAVNALEGGRRRAPRRDTVRSLADALRLSGADRQALLSAAGQQALLAAARRSPAARPVARAAPPIPAPPATLVGREVELRAAVELLRRADLQLLTMTGPPGVGKTSLALAVARELRAEFADGVFLVELAPVTDPDGVGSALRTALALHEAPDEPLADRLAGHIGSRHALLVLDNFEHVLGAAALVAHLLGRCPRLHALVTSRSPLRLRCEHELTVPPLAVPDAGAPLTVPGLARVPAVALFLRRVAASAPDFRLQAANQVEVAAICRRLEGLPLALELAAPWIRMLPPAALLHHLGRSLDLLVDGPRDLPDRQRTMRATVGWSYELLEPDERRLFRRLSVFAGPFDIGAAEAVCAGDGLEGLDVVTLLRRLIERSLVVVEPGESESPRYRLLEPVRQYAAERLEENGESDAVRRRHAAACAALAEVAVRAERRADQAEWLAALEAAHADLLAALEWCRGHDPSRGVDLAAGLGWFWLTRGHLSEGRHWLRWSLEAASEEAERARALYCLARLAYWQNDLDEARRCVTESLARWRELDRKVEAGWALNMLGYVRASAGDHAGARAALEEAMAAGVDDELGIDSQIGIGDVLIQAGAAPEARRVLVEAEATAAARAAPWQFGRARLLLAIAAYLEADHEGARRWATDSLEPLRQVGNWYGLAGAFDVFGAVALAGGDPRRALQLCAAAEALRRAIGTPLPESWRSLLTVLLIDPARAALGRAADAAWAEGAQLSPDRAIALALASDPAVPVVWLRGGAAARSQANAWSPPISPATSAPAPGRGRRRSAP